MLQPGACAAHAPERIRSRKPSSAIEECITLSGDVRLHRTPLDVLNYEIVQEQAAALGRMGRGLEAALAKLQEFDAAHPRAGAPVSAQQARRTLVIEAGYAPRVITQRWILPQNRPAEQNRWLVADRAWSHAGRNRV